MPISKVTTGSITDSVAIDTDTLVVDGTNGRVSIGTSSAESLPLTVAGSQSAIALVDTDRVDNTYYSAVWGDQVANLHLVADYQGTSGSSFISMRVGGTALANEKVRVDSSGRVTMPYQPVFFAYNLNFPGSNAAGTASGGSVYVNVGSHYDTGTGRFTAPIAGTYVFYMMTQSYDSGNTTGQYQTAIFRKNGSIVGAEAYHGWQPNDGNNHVQVQNTVIITLAANDYMMAYVQYGSRDIQNYFGGYLLG